MPHDIIITGDFVDGRFTTADQGGGSPEPGDAVLLSRLALTPGIVPSTEGPNMWGFNSSAGGVMTCVNDGTHTYLRAQYPTDASGDQSGANYFGGGYTPETVQQELYITMYVRMPAAKYGFKCCKLFGVLDLTSGFNTANTTFTIEYGSGEVNYIAYGDGTTITNDTQNGVGFATPNYQDPGRTGSLTRTLEAGGVFPVSEWGTGWHKFQVHHKCNSGTSALNEINDGITESIIDGVMRGRGTNIFNRHWSNGFIETINFFGYTAGQSAFEVHMRDITVSTGGWVD